MGLRKDNYQLVPDRHPQGELFICDIADAILKSDMASMEHPIFGLSKKPDLKERVYRHNDITLTVTPSVRGLATIWDKDILIFAMSQLMAAKNAGEPISREISMSARSFLIFANRHTGGHDYELLDDALVRLRGTTLQTNIQTGGMAQTDVFGIVDSASVRRDPNTNRITDLRIELSEWLFNAIAADEVLTLPREYFRLAKALDRRIYEIARKHCGSQLSFKISLELLRKKSGSSSAIRKFRFFIRGLEENDHLPDYRVQFDPDKDMVEFINRDEEGKIEAATSGLFLSGETMQEAKGLAPGWDIYHIEQQWRGWIAKGIADGMMEAPRNPDRAFLGFCRKWFEDKGAPN